MRIMIIDAPKLLCLTVSLLIQVSVSGPSLSSYLEKYFFEFDEFNWTETKSIRGNGTDILMLKSINTTTGLLN